MPVAACKVLDVGFSPGGSAQALVIRTLDDASQSIRLMGYSVTSPEIVKSLIAAKRRGVNVKVVLDERAIKASLAAVNAGSQLRTDDNHSIMHDKVLIMKVKMWTQGRLTIPEVRRDPIPRM